MWTDVFVSYLDATGPSPMIDIALETARTVILLGLTVFLFIAGRDRFNRSRKGWNLILAGFLLLLFGSALDITDNFESLNPFLVIGDTQAQAFLEKAVGFLGGFICVAVGLVLWVPTVQRLSDEVSQRERSEEKLRDIQGHLEETVRRRTSELDSANTDLQREIAEHKRVRQELEEIKLRDELILEAAGEGIYGLDLEGRTTFANPAAAHMIGWTPEELLGQPQHDILHHSKPDGTRYPREECPIYAAFRDGQVHHVTDEVFWRKDGTSFPVEYVSTPIRKDGELVGAVVVFRDVTERRRAEAAKRESEARLTAIMENAPAEIYLKDAEGRYVLINRQYERLWGVTNEGVRGKLPEQIHDQSEFAEAARAHDLAVLESGEVIERENDVLMNDGPHTLHMIKFPIRDAAGRIAGLGAIATDVTKQKWAERAILASKEEADQANRTKAEFLANMSHELRTPLNAIIGYSEFIQAQKPGAEGHPRYAEFAGNILEAGRHLLDLINDILNLSKIEARGSELTEEEIEIPELLRAVERLLKQRAERQGIDLQIEWAEDLPHLWADRCKLKQVLINLVTNSIKFTELGGKVTLRAWFREPGGYVFQVTDTGIGIALADIPKALSQFGQVDNPLSREHEGTGLGLPLSKALVEMHGGSLDLQSKPGYGTTVTVRVPAERISDKTGATAPAGEIERAAG